MICPNCGHKNDADAEFCAMCGTNLISSGAMSNLTKALILVIIVLTGLVAVFGYTYFSGQNQNQTPSVLNNTTENSTNITWTPEYISFDKAKSIAIKNAAPEVTVSDPILLKNQHGVAIYVCYYYYDSYPVGGIIINAKTGEVIYKEQNLPSESYQQTDTSYYDENNDYHGGDDYQDDYYHADYETCPTCGGAGVVPIDPNDPESTWETCPTCGGDGVVPAGS